MGGPSPTYAQGKTADRRLPVYLLPVGVVAYTVFGGLKATILTDWVHTFILLIIIIIFALTTYATSDVLGSPGAVYDALVEAAKTHPVEGNKGGSYLTMQSREGAIFFVINIVGMLSRSHGSLNRVTDLGRQFWHRLP